MLLKASHQRRSHPFPSPFYGPSTLSSSDLSHPRVVCPRHRDEWFCISFLQSLMRPIFKTFCNVLAIIVVACFIGIGIYHSLAKDTKSAAVSALEADMKLLVPQYNAIAPKL